jgi:O-antigen ligase
VGSAARKLQSHRRDQPARWLGAARLRELAVWARNQHRLLLCRVLALDTAKAWNYFEALTKIVLPFLVGVTTIDSLEKVKKVAWVIVLSEGYVALEINLSYFGGYNRIWEEGFGGMDNNCNAIAMVTCAGLAAFLTLHAQGWWRKGLAFSAWLWMVHAILLSMSRGGMLALGLTMFVGFLLIPKRLPHYVAFAVGVALLLRLAGPMVVDRFKSAFVGAEQRDYSAQSRLDLWSACWQCMVKQPLGIGPAHFPLVAEEYGFPAGKEAHSLWMQLGAELGFPGLVLLLSFYGLCLARLWPLTKERAPAPDPWFRNCARMIIASLVGFGIAAQFVSLHGLEHPYYIVMMGVCVLKLYDEQQARAAFTGQHSESSFEQWGGTDAVAAFGRRSWSATIGRRRDRSAQG